MFFLNLGWSWATASAIDDLRGVVILPASNSMARVTRNARPEARRVLLDPQLYLAGLDAGECSKVCARLASFPWFGVAGLPEFDSAVMSRKEWDAAMQAAVVRRWRRRAPDGDDVATCAASAVEVQIQAGCTHIILPAPLCSEREDQGETLGAWLDGGIEAAEEADTGRPLIATIAVDEATLNDAAFVSGGFLDALMDQVTARGSLNGVYVVVSQVSAIHPFESSAAVQRAYAHVTTAARRAGLEFIITNFADVFGLACLATGASDFATGPSQSLRRLSLAAFRNDGFGRALPHLYTHAVIAEYLPESDLPRIVERRLLARVEDETSESAPLLAAIRRRESAATVAAWAESPNNVTASQLHFLLRLIEEERRLRRLGLPDRQQAVQDWLESAAANALYINSRIADPPLRGRVAPAQQWLDQLDAANV